MYFDIVHIEGVDKDRWDQSMLSVVAGLVPALPLTAGKPELAVRVYHAIIFTLLLLVGRWLLFWAPLLPYRRNLARIDGLLDSLSSRTVRRRSSWKPAQLIHLFFGDSSPSEVEQAPTDSRSIEQAFLEILRELQNSSLGHLRGAMQRISIPAPEITFVFDELDKLGVSLDAEQSRTADSPEDIDIMGAERQRSIALHRLMSDLKRILSSAPARFIFVGGRQLHDEWLADQTSRQPLLTSIFNAEVYLPSLLTDHGLAHLIRQGTPKRLALHDRIRDYLTLQHYRATHNMAFWTSARWRSVIGAGFRWEQPESFFQPGNTPAYDEVIEKRWKRLTVINPHVTDGPDAREEPWRREFLRSFVRFLTYRSAGNPKRLRELMLGFLQPVGRVIPDVQRWTNQTLACHDTLYFNDDDVFRIQLLDSVYRTLVDRFGSRLVQRDDKIAASLFFIADFLFKFHMRAFAWGNLERIEELVHIHRAPDLRLILEELIEHSTERFLHRVLNGMYAFRFRSEFSREIEYLSRRSEDDLAAFNFTLDESQTLKRPYMIGLRTANADNPEIYAGVGELFEFDKEFEMARHHYRTAIVLLDRDLDKLWGDRTGPISTRGSDPDWSALGEVLAGTSAGQQTTISVVAWGLARLRLMLQIGMTYELSRNQERAEAEYRGAFVLAERLFDAFIYNAAEPWPNDFERQLEAWSPGTRMAWRFRSGHALKHTALIYQPVFAIAWIAEKLIGDIDTSSSIIEEYIDNLRNRLPFVREREEITIASNGQRTSHSSFALIVSELHRKAGDLYFFKGRQSAPFTGMAHSSTASTGNAQAGRTGAEGSIGAEGWLLSAHYHYIVTLHELRRHVQARMLASAGRHQPQPSSGVRDGRGRITILEGQFPSYIHLAIGNALSDLSDSLLSRVSMSEFLKWLSDTPPHVTATPGQGGTPIRRPERFRCHKYQHESSTGGQGGDLSFSTVFRNWFEKIEPEKLHCWQPDINIREVFSENDETLEHAEYFDFLGHWIGYWDCRYCAGASPNVVNIGIIHPVHQRLLIALEMSALSADYFGSYRSEAAQEYMKCCETVTTVFWWITGLRRLASAAPGFRENSRLSTFLAEGQPDGMLCGEGTLQQSYLLRLERIAVDALKHAVDAMRKTRLGRDGVNRTPRGYLEDGTLPPALLTLACSLYLSVRSMLGSQARQLDALANLIATLTGGETIPDGPPAVRAVLRESVVRNRFPALNRLNALNVLINAEIAALPPLEGLEQTGRSDHLERIDGYVREWLVLLDGFDAPLHFTPLAVGSTLTWFCLLLKESGIDLDHSMPYAHPLRSQYLKYRTAAERQLERGQQMHTMGAAYYEAISGLYYLYDDFNDRHIHFHHALQMMGTEVISVLLEHLRRTDGPLAGREPR